MDIKKLNEELEKFLEGDVVSFADYKVKKDGKNLDAEADVFTDMKADTNVVNVHIDSVTVTFVEGNQDDNRFVYNKPYSYEEIQSKINEEDYKVANVDVEHGGYNKFYYDAEITIDGKKETYKDGRLDLGDGFNYGPENVSIKYMIAHYLPKMGFEDKTIVVDNPDVKYDTAGYMLKYGTREENIDKYIADHKTELPTSTDYSAKSNVEVGDIFYYSDSSDYSGNYYHFFKVVRTTKASAWVEPIDKDVIKVPVKKQDKHDKRVMLDDARYFVPTDKKLEKAPYVYGMDITKPFRITTSYDNKPLLVQGSRSKVYLSAWKGRPLSEGVKRNKLIGKKLNENVTKMSEDNSGYLSFDELFDKYVPSTGKADTVGGEILRATARIIYRYYNDGDMAGRGYGVEVVNPAVRYLASQDDENLQDFANELFNVKSEKRYERILKELEEFVTDYVQGSNLLNEPNAESFTDYISEEDKMDIKKLNDKLETLLNKFTESANDKYLRVTYDGKEVDVYTITRFIGNVIPTDYDNSKLKVEIVDSQNLD